MGQPAWSPTKISIMPLWTLVAAGRLHATDREHFREKITAILSDPRYQAGVTLLHIDEDTRPGEPLAAECA